MKPYLLFLVSLSAFATTKAKESGQPVQSLCEMRAIFQAVSYQKITRNVRDQSREGNWVYWDVEVQDVSNQEICPREKKLSVRLRSATFRQEGESRIVTYPVDLSQPEMGDRIKISLYFSKGKDTYLQKEFSEWTLSEVLENE